MTRRIIGLLVTLALGLCVGPLTATAQSPGKVARIGFLSTGGIPNPSCSQPDFLRGLQELGMWRGTPLA
jgi:hypothetical protein